MRKDRLETLEEYTKREGLNEVYSKEDYIFSKELGRQLARVANSMDLFSAGVDKACKEFNKYTFTYYAKEPVNLKVMGDCNKPTLDLDMLMQLHPNCRCGIDDLHHLEKWGPDYYRTSTGYIIGGDDGFNRRAVQD